MTSLYMGETPTNMPSERWGEVDGILWMGVLCLVIVVRVDLVRYAAQWQRTSTQHYKKFADPWPELSSLSLSPSDIRVPF